MMVVKDATQIKGMLMLCKADVNFLFYCVALLDS